MSWLSDVYGPRLTWSPNVIRGARLGDGRDEAVGPRERARRNVGHAGRPRVAESKFSFMATSPAPFIVEAVPQAWSVRHERHGDGTRRARQRGCLASSKQQYAGKLKNAFIMTAPPRDRPVNAFTATATRYTDSTLAVMAAAQPAPAGGRGGGGGRGGRGGAPRAIRDVPAAVRARFDRRRGGGRARWPRRSRRVRRWRSQRRRHEHRALAAAAGGRGDPARRREPRRRRHRHEQRRVARPRRRRGAHGARRAGVVRTHRAHGARRTCP